MVNLKKNFILSIILAFTLISFVILSLVYKLPVSTGAPDSPLTKNLYYKGLLNKLYLRMPRDCGFWGCVTPDYFPFLRDSLVKKVNASNFKYAGFGCSNNIPLSCSTGAYIYQDGKNVIIADSIVQGSDLQSLTFKGNIAYDVNNVYDDGIIHVSDPSSYQKLICRFYQDKTFVYSEYGRQIQKDYKYFETQPITTSDKFRLLVEREQDCFSGKPIAEDDKSVYALQSGGGLIVRPK
ncbi:hypothetical protein A3A75_05115 [Candidatus Woesebacteria bacterium RIFCSPLOWO2_01_FULL_39_10]|uniref:Uncharacterized protein n=1 Tax=Candidatus Woesebacteria bacterium RIFCSPLOWO2_01_FULL_39_10 TaxID=1802516 RepID=A0A1F8B4S7_9BACT|nr:MAG: hypothetical protein A3A75_05115 [Candidatus Woesebacteria bacterium RIFCSPLOWO2_01_FULL_39_10]